ncbi:E3 ubiquitin-protein ligase TRIM39-like [Clarias gariepinus]
MASSSSVLCEDQLQCSICLDVFTDPVSTPCGHNYCMICLKEFWDSSLHSHCPVCKEEIPKCPKLRVNTFISELAASFKKSVQVKSSSAADQQPSKNKRVLCVYCIEEAEKSCLHCGVSFCNIHLVPHKTTAKLMKHKLMDPVENLVDYICQKHERPLELFCRDDQTFVCQFCIEGDHRTHNTVPMKEFRKIKTQEEVREMIQKHLNKIKEIKHSVEVNNKNTEKEKADVVEIFSALMRCFERSQAELLKVMEEKQKAAERQAEEFIKDLEQEITELKRRNTELEQLSHTEDHLHLLQIYPSLCSPPHTQDWTDVTINSRLSVGPLVRIKLHKTFNKEMEKLIEIEIKTSQQYAVNVTLDPKTVNPMLFLSNDRKQVRYRGIRQNLPDNPKRFDWRYAVLGKDGFSSGRIYYEVVVKGKVEWHVGVIRESINRKGKFTVSPKNGFWTIYMENKNKYKALEPSPVTLTLKQAPQKVGVFVDYEEGLISFYDVDAKSNIYSFSGQTFTEKLYPIFNPCDNEKGNNSAPLIICSFH